MGLGSAALLEGSDVLPKELTAPAARTPIGQEMNQVRLMREFFGYRGDPERLNSPNYTGKPPSQHFRGLSIKEMLIISLDIETYADSHFSVGITLHERDVLAEMLPNALKDHSLLSKMDFVASVCSYQFEVVPAGQTCPAVEGWAFLYGCPQVVTAQNLGQKIHDLLYGRDFIVITHKPGVSWNTLVDLGIPVGSRRPHCTLNTMMLSACVPNLRARSLQDLLVRILRYDNITGWGSTGNEARYDMLALFIIAWMDAEVCRVRDQSLLRSLEFMCTSPVLFQETRQPISRQPMGWEFVYATLADLDRELARRFKRPLANLPVAVSWMTRYP